MPWEMPPYVTHQRLMESQLGEELPWSLTDYGIPAGCWDKGVTGTSVVVGVVDTGVDQAHKELGDLKGRVVDVQDFSGSRFGWRDVVGHGTHVAGTIAAAFRNGIGVAGVAPEANLYIAKALNDNGNGTEDSIASAIRWLVSCGCQIINLSLGSPQPSLVIRAAVDDAARQGSLVVVAAGNSSGDVGYPAKWPSCLAVTAFDRNRVLAPFSCFGPEVDIGAPGVEILSTYLNGTYGLLSGTCLAQGSYVYGPEGPKTIENVKVGDTVFAYKDGRVVERVVHASQYRGMAEVHQLRAGGRDVLATGTHQMLALNTRARDIEWVRVDDLTDDHRLLLPQALPTRINPHLDAQITEDFAWLLGFFLGDGWLCGTTSGAMRVCFARKPKPETMAKVERIYHETSGKLLSYTKNGNWSYDDSTKMACIIDSLGLNRPSTAKTVPLWLWNLPRNKQLAFFDGYTASDGHIYAHPGYKTPPHCFECSPSDLIRRLAAFADYQGWKHSTPSSRTRMLAPNSKEPRLSTSHSLVTTRVPVDGGWAILSNKHVHGAGAKVAADMGLDVDGLFLRSWERREGIETVPVYDLTVPDADCFVTQGLITHNSMATPWVSGFLALRLSWEAAHGGIKTTTVEKVKEFLESAADDVGPTGPDQFSGPGLPNGAKLVPAVVTPPPSGGGAWEGTVLPLGSAGELAFPARPGDYVSWRGSKSKLTAEVLRALAEQVA